MYTLICHVKKGPEHFDFTWGKFSQYSKNVNIFASVLNVLEWLHHISQMAK